MVKIVNREYLVDLVEQCHKDQEKNCVFCSDRDFFFCKKSTILEEELRKKTNNTSNSDVVVWKVPYYKNDPGILTVFPVHEK